MKKKRAKLKIQFKLALIFIAIVILSCLMFYSISNIKIVNIGNSNSFKENGDINYKVYLKDNDFYDTNYLDNNDKNTAYVASLIDKVNVNFKYNFNMENPSNINFNYSIIGKLSILNSNNGNVLFNKDYTLRAGQQRERAHRART